MVVSVYTARICLGGVVMLLFPDWLGGSLKNGLGVSGCLSYGLYLAFQAASMQSQLVLVLAAMSRVTRLPIRSS